MRNRGQRWTCHPDLRDLFSALAAASAEYLVVTAATPSRSTAGRDSRRTSTSGSARSRDEPGPRPRGAPCLRRPGGRSRGAQGRRAGRHRLDGSGTRSGRDLSSTIPGVEFATAWVQPPECYMGRCAGRDHRPGRPARGQAGHRARTGPGRRPGSGAEQAAPLIPSGRPATSSASAANEFGAKRHFVSLSRKGTLISRRRPLFPMFRPCSLRRPGSTLAALPGGCISLDE